MTDSTATALFTYDELRIAAGYPVDRERVTAVESVVWGRVKPILNVGARPSPRDDTVYAIALQLGILLYENPGLWSRSATGVDSTDYDTVAAVDGLLDALRGYVAGTSQSTASASPQGSFPAAALWPDPASGWPSW